MCDLNWSDDSRKLSFVIFLDNYLLSDKRVIPVNLNTPAVIFAFTDKKHKDSLIPIFNKLIKYTDCKILSEEDAVRFCLDNNKRDTIFVVCSPQTHDYIRAQISGGLYIYTEHGAAPLKRYTYSAHYTRYDLLLLPGALWVNRLGNLYPNILERCKVIGYPKVRNKVLKEKERLLFCKKYNLDNLKPIVLFAPTWSGGNPKSGIFNYKYLLDIEANIIIIPHDGDVQYKSILEGLGNVRVIELCQNETISDYYAFTDLLISDISSTAVEFSAINKPVVCMISDSLSDYDLRFIDTDGRLLIPYTSSHWDFCPVLTPELVAGKVNNILSDIKKGHAPNSFINKNLIHEMLHSIGDESVYLAVKEILSFVIKNRNLKI